MKTAAILLAGGKGERIGGNSPKQFLSLLGKPLLFYSLESFNASPQVDSIYLVLPEEEINSFELNFLSKFSVPKLQKIVSGGATRQDSALNGFQQISKDTEIVIIHDVARPFVRQEMIEQSIVAAKKWGAAIVASPVSDTIKEVREDKSVHKTLDRKNLYQVQTPQTFQYSVLKEGLEWAYQNNFQATDEATLVEKIGKSVRVVESDSTNLKITTPTDFLLAEVLLRKKRSLS